MTDGRPKLLGISRWEWLFVLVAAGVLVPLFFRTFRTHAGNAANRANLLGIYSNLTVGMSESEAVRAVSNRLTGELKLVNVTEGMFLRMPLEWGASDWNLNIDLANRVVTSVRIRTSDGPTPSGAPKDKP